MGAAKGFVAPEGAGEFDLDLAAPKTLAGVFVGAPKADLTVVAVLNADVGAAPKAAGAPKADGLGAAPKTDCGAEAWAGAPKTEVGCETGCPNADTGLPNTLSGFILMGEGANALLMGGLVAFDSVA